VSFPEATFRFYGDLIDLLTLPDESGVVVRTFDESPSVKDQIEACGVPHTEVDLILANGESVGFERRLEDGDRISVFPWFAALDISDVSRVRREPLPEPRFVADVNLGKLTRYLRLLGFDTWSDGSTDDAELATISAEQERILLTKDRPLLKRAIVTHGYLVRGIHPEEQIIEVLHRFGLAGSLEPFSRCIECNGIIKRVEKADVDHLLEPLTREHFDDFRQCDGCGRVFCSGSHFENLRKVVEEVRTNLT